MEYLCRLTHRDPLISCLDLVNRSRPGSRISAGNSRNTSRNCSPAPMGPGHRSRVDNDIGNETRDYAELVDEDGDYSTPSGMIAQKNHRSDFPNWYLFY